MVVQHNISAMNANRLYGINNSGLSKSLEKLSSGYAINRAGDNAAGLAVSEKMRAQISGLTQASKNAEDGISMIQTFEGALQETDSILQRMRTLAVQSANGTYQNDVDREAIQLEYDQLNDELNQIADTDFNGVVVLNGGQMADGLKAIDGEFNYANAERDAMQLSSNNVNKVDFQGFDDTDNTNGVTVADKVWNEISDGTWDRGTVGSPVGPDSVDVTLKFDKESNTWSVEGANNGANKALLEADPVTDNGGFTLKTTKGTTIANVVMDATQLKNGDTITLTLNNPKAAISAPTNGGAIVTDTKGYTEGVAADAKKAQDLNLDVSVENLADTDMTESINKLFNALNGATATANYKKTAATAAGDLSIDLSDGSSINLTASGKFTLKDGTEFYATIDANSIKISTVNAGGTADTDLVTISMTASTATDDGSGKVSYKIGINNNSYDTSKLPTVEVKDPENNAVSKSNSNDASTATLTYQNNITLQTGARTKDSVNFTFSYESRGLGELKADLDCSARGLGTDQLKLSTQKDANGAIDKIDNAINKVSMVRASFGAMQNRLEHKIANLDTNNENLTAAESRIRDTDMAEEMTNFTKNQILAQASQAMLAQANQLPQGVLQLLG